MKELSTPLFKAYNVNRNYFSGCLSTLYVYGSFASVAVQTCAIDGHAYSTLTIPKLILLPSITVLSTTSRSGYSHLGPSLAICMTRQAALTATAGRPTHTHIIVQMATPSINICY